MNKAAIPIFYALVLGHAREYIQSRVTINPATGCWLWTKSGDGRYGHAYFLGQRFKAHILSFLAFRGKYPKRRVLDHKECDVTNCCCPWHLEPVTQSKNMKRCFQIGRGRSPFLKVQNDRD